MLENSFLVRLTELNLCLLSVTLAIIAFQIIVKHILE